MCNMTETPTTGRKVHVAVHLDRETVELLDRYARDNDRSRSAAGAFLIARALRMFAEGR